MYFAVLSPALSCCCLLVFPGAVASAVESSVRSPPATACLAGSTLTPWPCATVEEVPADLPAGILRPLVHLVHLEGGTEVVGGRPYTACLPSLTYGHSSSSPPSTCCLLYFTRDPTRPSCPLTWKAGLQRPQVGCQASREDTLLWKVRVRGAGPHLMSLIHLDMGFKVRVKSGRGGCGGMTRRH